MAANPYNKSNNRPSENLEEKKIASNENSAADLGEIKEVMGAVTESNDVLGEIIDNKVSESTSGKREGDSGGAQATGSQTAQTATQIKSPPPIDVMIVEISTAIKEELKNLGSEAMKLKSSGKFSQLNLVVRQIRSLNFTMASLGSATFEAIKALWLKLVNK